MVEASVQMCICEIVMGVVLATQMDPVTGALSRNVTVGLIVVVSEHTHRYTASVDGTTLAIKTLALQPHFIQKRLCTVHHCSVCNSI